MCKAGNKMPNHMKGMQKNQLPVLVTFMILIFLGLILLIRNSGENPSSQSVQKSKIWNTFESLVQSDPTVEWRNGTDIIWQIPDSPKAVLFMAHGCDQRAGNFWDKSPKCPKCLGLPEERLITLEALARKFAVLAVSSAGKCWSLGKERLLLKEIIKWWIEKQKLEKLPLFALGASSGGYFVSVLANELKFSSIVLMIAEGVFDRTDIKKNYPPILFVHMPKDDKSSQKVAGNLKMLSKKGIEGEEVKCMEVPLTPSYLSDRIRGIDLSLSAELFSLFQEKGFIDKNSYLKKDGRLIHLKSVLKERKIVLPDGLMTRRIQEELNLAFAYHEMTSLPSEQMFNWFESHMN